MRKFTAVLALLAIAAFWSGCSYEKSTNPSTNSASTNPAAPDNAGASNANKGSYGTSTGATAPPSPATNTATPAGGGIKPPMKDEKK